MTKNQILKIRRRNIRKAQIARKCNAAARREAKKNGTVYVTVAVSLGNIPTPALIAELGKRFAE